MATLDSTAPQMFSLGQFATSDDVETAECADLDTRSTKPIEQAAFTFMQALNGWAFAVDPTSGGLFTACLPP
jgi:hypothetical protein